MLSQAQHGMLILDAVDKQSINQSINHWFIKTVVKPQPFNTDYNIKHMIVRQLATQSNTESSHSCIHWMTSGKNMVNIIKIHHY